MINAEGSSSIALAILNSGIDGMGRAAGSSPNREAIVSTGSEAATANIDPATTPMTRLGDRGANLRRATINTNAIMATPTAKGLLAGNAFASTMIFGMNSAGRLAMSRPRKSFNWLAAMMIAMPTVKPLITGSGTNAISRPARKKPATSRIAPAIIVANTSPS